MFNRQKYQIPPGTIVPAGGHVAFYESSFNSFTAPFSISALGHEVMLSAVDGTGALTGYGSLVRFGASPDNVSFGRVPAMGLHASSGGAEFWPQTAHTFGQDHPPDAATFRTGTGAANGAPRIGPVLINEIMYHPVDGPGGTDNTQDEFIELYNLSGSAVDLSGWRFKGDAEYTFPAGTVLDAGGYLLLVSFDPTNTATLAGANTGLSAAFDVWRAGSTASAPAPI